MKSSIADSFSDNTAIRQAICSAKQPPDGRDLQRVQDAVRDAVLRHGRILLAIEKPGREEPGGRTVFSPVILERGDLAALVAWTGQNQAQLGPDGAILCMLTEDALRLVLENDGAGGILLDPCDVAFFLSRRMIRDLFAQLEREENSPANRLLNEGAAAYQKGDYPLAMTLYARAADAGSATAMSNLGYCWYYGRSVPVDYVRARACFEKAAAQGDVCALYKLGDLHAKGRAGFAADRDKAAELYLEAFCRCVKSGQKDVSCYPDVCLRLAEHNRTADPDLALRMIFQAVEGLRQRLALGDHYTQPVLRRAQKLEQELLDRFDPMSEQGRALLQKAIDATYPGLTMYVRDAQLTQAQAARYEKGRILYEPGPVEASRRVMGASANWRIAILSSHMADLGTDQESLELGLFAARPGAHFRCLGRHAYHGKNVVFLLHLPDSEYWRLLSGAVVNLEEQIFTDCCARFDNKCELPPIPALQSADWQARCSRPVGFAADGTPLAAED